MGTVDLFGDIVPRELEHSAKLSHCRQYRYDLWRRWGEGPYCMFVGLNPSTADESNDDPTIRRCVGFAQSWGFGALCMTNLFAFRATKPSEMMASIDPVGPENDLTLLTLASGAGLVVAAWGAHGAFQNRDQEVRAALPALSYLRLTKHGHPGHPLYLPANLIPVPWRQ